jgi:hypothetical protein
MKKFLIRLSVLLIGYLLSSCNSSKTQFDDSIHEIDLNSTTHEMSNFPLSWERFEIVNDDTVTFSFENASNPEFDLSPDFKSIRIIIGNELDQSFTISKILYSNSKVKFILDKNTSDLNECTFKWIDKQRKIGALLLYDDQNYYKYLPKSRLKDKKVMMENEEKDDN